MTDQFPSAAPDGPESTDPTPSSATGGTVEPTGHPVVDDVLTDMASIDERPLEEHVEVFERAHEQLRRALDVPEQS